MRLRITTPIKEKKVKEKLVPLISNIEDENYNDEYELVSIIIFDILINTHMYFKFFIN